MSGGCNCGVETKKKQRPTRANRVNGGQREPILSLFFPFSNPFSVPLTFAFPFFAPLPFHFPVLYFPPLNNRYPCYSTWLVPSSYPLLVFFPISHVSSLVLDVPSFASLFLPFDLFHRPVTGACLFAPAQFPPPFSFVFSFALSLFSLFFAF